MLSIKTITFFVLVAFTSGQKKKSPIAIANYGGDRTVPININKTIKFDGTKLLLSGTGKGENAMLINTGTSVEVRLAGNKTDLKVTGSPTAGELFVYTRTIFYWAKSENGVAGTTISGKKGAPLEIAVHFYNTKYVSYFASLEEPDGVVEVRMLANANAKEDNEEFNSFAEKIKEVLKSGDSTEVDLKEHNSWYLKLIKKRPSKFYVFPGGVKNVTTGEMYNCSIDIVPESRISISPKQFKETFLKVKNSKGGNLITKQKAQKQGSRPVIFSTKVSFVYNSGDDIKLYSTDGSPGP